MRRRAPGVGLRLSDPGQTLNQLVHFLNLYGTQPPLPSHSRNSLAPLSIARGALCFARHVCAHVPKRIPWSLAASISSPPQVTAQLFGGIIARGVITGGELSTALKYVLQAIERPPNARMQQFGLQALDLFKTLLPDWPQYCSLLHRIRTLPQALPGIERYLTPATGPLPAGEGAGAMPPMQPVLLPPDPGGPGPEPPVGMQPPIGSPVQHMGAPVQQLPPMQQLPAVPGPGAPLLPPGAAGPMAQNKLDSGGFGHTFDIGTLVSCTEPVTDVPQDVADKTSFLMNNLMEANLEQTVVEMKKFLQPSHWVCGCLMLSALPRPPPQRNRNSR